MPDDVEVPKTTRSRTKKTDDAPEKVVKCCGTCKWWLRAYTTPDQAKSWGKQAFDFGECRGMPPTALSSNRTYEAAGEKDKPRPTVTIKQARFPHTYDVDWCAFWTPRED